MQYSANKIRVGGSSEFFRAIRLFLICVAAKGDISAFEVSHRSSFCAKFLNCESHFVFSNSIYARFRFERVLYIHRSEQQVVVLGCYLFILASAWAHCH